jgi:hypothetical protein
MPCYIDTMHRLDFAWELTALEVREPLIQASREVAAIHGLFAHFQHNQQAAFDGHSGLGRQRTRIGNGKHQAWRIEYWKEDPVHTPGKKATVVGAVAIKSLVDPSENLYGGFDYGKYGEPEPTYKFITLHTIEESGLYLYHATDELYQPTVEALEGAYAANLPRLF